MQGWVRRWFAHVLDAVSVGGRTMRLFVAKTHHLTTLHTILSTGSPLKPQLFDFVYSDIKSDVLLGSITGGTDIIACFAGNNASLPVFRGEIQSLHLGCAIQSWSEEGMTHACSHFPDEPGLADCPINFFLPRVSKVCVLLWQTKTFYILLTAILCLQCPVYLAPSTVKVWSSQYHLCIQTIWVCLS